MADVGRTRGRVTSVVMHPLCLKATGIIQHEILHALGFLHEHSRPDRDDYVTVNASNIVPGIDPRNWVKLREMETFGLPYDLESVMHYGPEVSISPDRPAIVPRTTLLTRWMGQRRGLSSWDVAKLQIAYKCNRFEGPLRSLDSSRTNTPELDVDVKTFTASFYLLPNGSYDPQLQQPVVWWQDNSFSGWYGTAAANPLLSPAIVTCLALLMAA
ncbi:astacin-like metalloendopeptidase [Paramacrobiotus metropolitanus]|uniref:astacin-like metalloendopeptidase n=1 Tax=Paramacrobiotus metropolitanus TaxID=2943436 RepID=UPI0024461BEC|nr:astacin-like metalloendopeptidase [Paramacrobiotus metropolitanus]